MHGVGYSGEPPVFFIRFASGKTRIYLRVRRRVKPHLLEYLKRESIQKNWRMDSDDFEGLFPFLFIEGADGGIGFRVPDVIAMPRHEKSADIGLFA